MLNKWFSAQVMLMSDDPPPTVIEWRASQYRGLCSSQVERIGVSVVFGGVKRVCPMQKGKCVCLGFDWNTLPCFIFLSQVPSLFFCSVFHSPVQRTSFIKKNLSSVSCPPPTHHHHCTFIFLSITIITTKQTNTHTHTCPGWACDLGRSSSADGAPRLLLDEPQPFTQRGVGVCGWQLERVPRP